MKIKVTAVIVILCMMAIGCKQNNKVDVTEEFFDTHPEWTEDNPDAFWE